MAKSYELKVKTGSYTDVSGQVKNRYETIGSVMEGERGPYMLLKRTFNPAGVEVDPGRDMVMVSMFEPRPQDFQDDIPAAPGKKTQAGYQDQNIPF